MGGPCPWHVIIVRGCPSVVVVTCPVLKTHLEGPLPGFVRHRREIQVRTEVVTLPGGVDTALRWRLRMSSHGLYRVCSDPDYEGTSALATVVSPGCF